MKRYAPVLCGAVIGIIALTAIPAFGTLPVIVAEDYFDDGNYDGWIGGDPTGYWITAADWHENPPIIVPSPKGFALAGTQPTFSGEGNMAYMVKNFSSMEVCVEFRAKASSGYAANVTIIDASQPQPRGYDMYVFGRDAVDNVFFNEMGGDGVLTHVEDLANPYEFHDFAFTRDSNGWWSFTVDGNTTANFRQDSTFTTFNQIGLWVGAPDGQIEWARVSIIPEPASLSLLALGGLVAIRRRRPHA